MSKIPCPFEWKPKYFRNNGWHKDHKLLAYVDWAFSRCSTETHKFFWSFKEIELDPFEYISGLEKCSEETGLSVQEIRTIQEKLIKNLLLQKSTSKSTSKFTVYKWTEKVFSENINKQINSSSTSEQQASNNNQEALASTEKKESSSNAKIHPISEGWTYHPELRPAAQQVISKNNCTQHTLSDVNSAATQQNQILSDVDFAAAALSFCLGHEKFSLSVLYLKTLRDLDETPLEKAVLSLYVMSLKEFPIDNPEGFHRTVCKTQNFQNLRILPETEEMEVCDDLLKQKIAN